jgi:hypothetical protein
MPPELVRVFYGPPNHPGLEFFFIGFGPGRIFGHTARRRRGAQPVECHQVVSRQKPEASDVAICTWLARKWSKKPQTLRRILQNARNPKHNTELGSYVREQLA